MGDDVAARRTVPEVFDAVNGHFVRANAEMTAAVSSGALTCGQCPIAFRVTSSLSGTWAWTKAPTSRGAIASWLHSMTKAGNGIRDRSARLSERNVALANTLACSGSVRQN